MSKIRLTTPLTNDVVNRLKSGDQVLISGTVYTGRDAAHLRLVKAIEEGESLPFEVEGQIIYYVGPAPAKPGEVIGSCGPTTSYRMDDLTEPLLALGLKGMIGKGERNQTVVDGMKNHRAIYFAAIGGAGALIANAVKESTVIAYEDLGPEAIRKLVVEDLPAIVVIDADGDNLYETERAKYQKK
ncbi:Fe-S-containing hydro-lyase [Fusibacter ferrireducens]|uniref:Fe-S-containing hydro-lyase n=1 Tax=Fusibacter ferrireducens TaxID=2785058 RepID=A0ABS0A0D4_9FIRM|nr:Fe-S-containing hydro-lyase [Fusibacter ferrireducens]MBF4695610.1 Fe-S-containing hydro-lyase [Fusibacter ferrireducens]